MASDRTSHTVLEHYKNLPMQYTENFYQPYILKNSLEKNSIFNNLAQNIDFGYTLEPPR